MNLHGPVGLFSMAMAIAGIWLGNYLVGTQGWGLEGAALALAVATTIGNGVAIPVYACRMMSLRLGVYIRRAFGGPIVATAPFAISLLFIRIFQGESPWVALGLASICAVFVLGAVYWNWVVPLSLRQSLTRRFDVTRWVMRGPRKNIQPLNDPAVRGDYRRP